MRCSPRRSGTPRPLFRRLSLLRSEIVPSSFRENFIVDNPQPTALRGFLLSLARPGGEIGHGGHGEKITGEGEGWDVAEKPRRRATRSEMERRGRGDTPCFCVSVGRKGVMGEWAGSVGSKGVSGEWPFDCAQGEPFDCAQDKPFDCAQGERVASGRTRHGRLRLSWER